MVNPTRANLITGPAKVVRGSYISMSETDSQLKIVETLSDVQQNGQVIDKRWIGYIADYIFAPDGRFTSAQFAIYNAVANLTPGASLFGTSDTTAVITDSNAHTLTMEASAFVELGSLVLHPEKPMVGRHTLRGILATGKDFNDAASLITHAASGGTFADSTFTPSDVVRQTYTAAYGAVAGLTAFAMQDGWTIDFRLNLAPIVVEGVIRDYRFTGLEVMARGIPVQPTTAEYLAALFATPATGRAPGRSLFADAAALTIVGDITGTTHVTIPKATPYTGVLDFAGNKLRTGEIGFYSARNFATGVQAALYTIA